ncbi:hypothetical protein QTH87_04665 [Variovorax sp. J22P168]|uniref:hypothetical protein n=1 Tax=Variovorax jilinensis TaxID=3053513 RepID=UPI002577A229|nr:hypothetical protein [Variovorax sp. J22P168]MDM0011724.1 hypothetical protein [Variovorax sp. J22P168]
MRSNRDSTKQWTPKAILALLRSSLPRAGAQASRPAAAPVARALTDPPEPLSVEELGEVAKNWRSRSDEEDGRADTVAQALESLADYRRAAARPRSRASAVGQRLSDFMRI